MVLSDLGGGQVSAPVVAESAALRDVGELLEPRSVAVVGASERNPAIVNNALAGPVPCYLVNPRRDEVMGHRCYGALSELPELPSTAILAVGHTLLVQAAEEAVAAGVRALVVPGGGAEAGRAGLEIGSRLARLAAQSGVAVLGANCMGLARPQGTSLWIGVLPESFGTGRVSVVAQSGSVAEGLVALGGRIGFQSIVSAGSELSRDAADFVAAFATDPATQAVGLFLEAARRPQALSSALAACADAGKPVVCLKVGRSPAAARIALSHTGALVGSALACSAFLTAHGVIEVDDLPDFVETLDVLGRARRPRGRRLAAVSESGGEAELLADHAAAAGLVLEPLPREVASAIEGEFPNFLEAANPLDAWAIDEPELVYPRTLELLAASDSCDVLVAQVDLTQFRSHGDQDWCRTIVQGLVAAARGRGVFPAVVSSQTNDPPREIAEDARASDLPLLRGAGPALRALAAAATWQPRRPATVPLPSPALLADGRQAPGPHGGEARGLSEHDSTAMLSRRGVPFAESRRAGEPAAAAAAAAELGFPVVVKVDGPSHKSAVGGVVLGVASPEEAERAAASLGGRVLVARQLPPGIEVICGFQRDAAFGPVLLAGLGGALAETGAGRPAVALAPLKRAEAEELVASVPGLARAASSSARQELAGILVALSELALEEPGVQSADLNPVVLSGDRAIAVDALVVVAAGEEVDDPQQGQQQGQALDRR